MVVKMSEIEKKIEQPDLKDLVVKCVALRKKFNEHIYDILQYVKTLEIEELEELESIRAYDSAKECGGDVVPFEKAVDEIERGR